MFNRLCFVSSEQIALLRPLLTKAGLDGDDMANYHPVPNLSFLSKIMECPTDFTSSLQMWVLTPCLPYNHHQCQFCLTKYQRVRG